MGKIYLGNGMRNYHFGVTPAKSLDLGCSREYQRQGCVAPVSITPTRDPDQPACAPLLALVRFPSPRAATRAARPQTFWNFLQDVLVQLQVRYQRLELRVLFAQSAAVLEACSIQGRRTSASNCRRPEARHLLPALHPPQGADHLLLAATPPWHSLVSSPPSPEDPARPIYQLPFVSLSGLGHRVTRYHERVRSG